MINKHLLIAILTILATNLYAQVTIGGDFPPTLGTLLHLKENNSLNENSSSGLLLPRVNLQVRNELYPMFTSNDPLYTNQEKIIHTGLIVYNVATDAREDLCPGPYVWNGNRWDRLWESCFFFDFLCSTLAHTTYTKEEGKEFKETDYIYYKSTVEINIVTQKTYSYGNGLSLVVPAQKIEQADNGFFYFYIQGDGTTPAGQYDLSLSDLKSALGINISSSCMISVNIEKKIPFELRCENVYTTGYVGVDMSSTDDISIVKIPYTLSEGSYFLPARNIGTYENITAYVDGQLLEAPEGFITVKFTGVPQQPFDKVPFTLVNEECSIYLSVIKPPSACPNGSSGRAFVFSQNKKWYVVTLGTSTAETFEPVTIECNSEEEALRHPDALQYCGDQDDSRCIILYNREGVREGVIYTVDTSTKRAIATRINRCWESFNVHSGSRIQSLSNPTGYLGAVNISNGRGSMGITNEIATMTTKALR